MEILMAKMRRGGGWAQIVMGHGGGDGISVAVVSNLAFTCSRGGDGQSLSWRLGVGMAFLKRTNSLRGGWIDSVLALITPRAIIKRGRVGRVFQYEQCLGVASEFCCHPFTVGLVF